MTDYLVGATACSGLIRAFAATTKNTVETARSYHNTTPVATAALGRMLTGGAIMGATLKNDMDILTITVKGDGPLQGVVVTADSKSRVKGYCAEPFADMPLKPNGKLDVGGAIGFGTLSVIKDMGLKMPMVGQIPLVSGEIADDLTYYYAKSEQIPTSIALGVLVDKDLSVKQSGGFLLQLMPGATEEIVSACEEKLAHLDTVTNMLVKGMTPEDILSELLGSYDLKIYDRQEVKYECNCSREKIKSALAIMGKEELEDIIKTDKKANVHCHFCNKDYDFYETELKELLEKI